MKRYSYRIGAIFYVLWGLLHIVGASALLWQAFNEGATAVLASIGSNTPINEIPILASELTTAVLAYYAWNLLWVGLFVAFVGGRFNWHNSRMGYWLNLVVVSAVDGGLVLLVLLPGHMAWSDGMLGVSLWIPAVVFSTIGLLANGGQPVRQATVA